MIKIYKTSINLKEVSEEVKTCIINDYHTNEVQNKRINKQYNFKLDKKYSDLILSLSTIFLNEVNKQYSKDINLQTKLDIWAYVSNKYYYDSVIHNHASTANINGVYYLNVPNAAGGELEFYNNKLNKISSIKPKTNDLLIFDGKLNHKPLPCDSDEYRIALNIEIKFN